MAGSPTGCHAMTITSCSSKPLQLQVINLRNVCQHCQRGQGCVLHWAASILAVMRLARAWLRNPWRILIKEHSPTTLWPAQANATTDYQSGQVALQQRIKSQRFTFIWPETQPKHLKGHLTVGRVSERPHARKCEETQKEKTEDRRQQTADSRDRRDRRAASKRPSLCGKSSTHRNHRLSSHTQLDTVQLQSQSQLQ